MTAMLFVTGMLRCGTTLLEKLLASHPQISLLSQPFPYLFFEAKRAFLQSLGRPAVEYPMGDLFLERGYTPADLGRFLAAYRPGPAQLLDTFRAMAAYSGQRTRFDDARVEEVVAGLEPADFAGTLEQLYRELGQQKSAVWAGGKETLCEEFVPYLLDRGAFCIIILRDPRDMLASMNHGRGEEFVGARRPTLFNLRQWRKSVAFALHLQHHARFAWMRYEDLVTQPVPVLDRLTDRLGVERFPRDLFAAGIRDQEGRAWGGNSSHARKGGVDDASVGRYRDLLPAPVIRYAEAVCRPELQYLGYEVDLMAAEAHDAIASFSEPYDVRESLRAAYSDPARVHEEVDRADYLFDDVRALLRKAAER